MSRDELEALAADVVRAQNLASNIEDIEAKMAAVAGAGEVKCLFVEFGNESVVFRVGDSESGFKETVREFTLKMLDIRLTLLRLEFEKLTVR